LADNTAFVPGKTSRADGGKVSCFHDGSAIHRTHPHRQPDVDKTSYNTMLQRAGGRLRAQTGSYGGGARIVREPDATTVALRVTTRIRSFTRVTLTLRWMGLGLSEADSVWGKRVG
jgi:hypothetical protein